MRHEGRPDGGFRYRTCPPRGIRQGPQDDDQGGRGTGDPSARHQGRGRSEGPDLHGLPGRPKERSAPRRLRARRFLPVWVGEVLIFYDTSAWVALAVPGDRNGPKAKRLQAEVTRGAFGAIVTTSFVLDEAAAFGRRETDTESAGRLLRSILASGAITTVWIDPGHFGSALELFQSHRDKAWSLTDCTSFVVMRDLGIETAFSFDRNFAEAGFTRLPEAVF